MAPDAAGRSAAPVSVSWPALGSETTLAVTDPAALADARIVVERGLAEIDQACSRFRSDSDLSAINARPGRAVEVGALCLEAVEAAIRAAVLTDGDVDPALGGELVLSGYDRDYDLLDLDVPPPRSSAGRPAGPAGPGPNRVVLGARRRDGWRTICVDARRSTVRVGPGVQLDLGATAKALAADRVARAAAALTGCGVLVGLGGDIAVAGPPPPGGWSVLVTDDHRSPADAPGELVSIAEGGLATSSTLARRWRHGGRTMHHIIDPATGRPARETWVTVSAAAATCLDANIATTAALVRGSGAAAWLGYSGLPARLVAADRTVVRIGGWPAPAAAGSGAAA